MKRLEVRPGFVALLCFLFYISPGMVFWSFLMLSALHELGHLAVLRIFSIQVRKIRLGAFGAVMDTAPMSFFQEAICALAGPMVNIVCFFLLKGSAPGTALLSLLLGCYNLLPVFPLDGGRALRALLCSLMPLKAARIAEMTASILTLAAIACLSVQQKDTFGILPLWLFTILLGHLCFERNTCCELAGSPI